MDWKDKFTTEELEEIKRAKRLDAEGKLYEGGPNCLKLISKLSAILDRVEVETR